MSDGQPQVIPLSFRKNGWHYKLVARTKHGAIYSQSTVADLPASGKACAYEVVRIRSRAARVMKTASGDVQFPAGEYLPNSEEWGQYGWTFVTMERAMDKLSAIGAAAIAQKANA